MARKDHGDGDVDGDVIMSEMAMARLSVMVTVMMRQDDRRQLMVAAHTQSGEDRKIRGKVVPKKMVREEDDDVETWRVRR
jgi:hypothetical protein